MPARGKKEHTEAFGVTPLRDVHLVEAERRLRDRLVCLSSQYERCRSYIVGTGVAEDVVKCILLRDVLGRLANYDRELDLVVREVLVNGLSSLRDDDSGARPNDRARGLVE